MTYREPARPIERATIDIVRRHSEYRLVVLSGEPRRGECSECRHLVGHVNWWCDDPSAEGGSNCGSWEAPPMARPAQGRRWLGWLWGLFVIGGGQ